MVAPRPATRITAPRVAVVVAVALASLWLLASREPTYDPWAWLVWGRQISEGTLDTVAGPSWKPFPVIFTTVYAFLGDAAAPLLWLVTARAGFLLCLFFAFRVARGVAGPVAGVLAAAGVALIESFASLSARGNSEGLLVAFVLGGVDRHRAGRPSQALAFGIAASLLRPEVWPFAALYAIWWILAAGPVAGRPRRLLVAAGAGVGVLALWFIPERIGSGSFLRGASRAREPVAGSPGQSDHPFLNTFTHASHAVDPVFYAGGVIAVALALLAWRRRRAGADDRLVLVLAAASTAYMVIVGILAEAGFTGNERYVTLPASVVCVLGGIGIVQGATLLGRRLRSPAAGVAIAGVAVVALSIGPASGLVSALRHTVRQGELYDGLAPIIEQAGGRQAILRCPTVYTGPFETQLLAWHLHVPSRRIGIHPQPPGTILAVALLREARDPRFPLRDRGGGWVLRSTCAG